jgi:hypothetical protein
MPHDMADTRKWKELKDSAVLSGSFWVLQTWPGAKTALRDSGASEQRTTIAGDVLHTSLKRKVVRGLTGSALLDRLPPVHRGAQLWRAPASNAQGQS